MHAFSDPGRKEILLPFEMLSFCENFSNRIFSSKTHVHNAILSISSPPTHHAAGMLQLQQSTNAPDSPRYSLSLLKLTVNKTKMKQRERERGCFASTLFFFLRCLAHHGTEHKNSNLNTSNAQHTLKARGSFHNFPNNSGFPRKWYPFPFEELSKLTVKSSSSFHELPGNLLYQLAHVQQDKGVCELDQKLSAFSVQSANQLLHLITGQLQQMEICQKRRWTILSRLWDF